MNLDSLPKIVARSKKRIGRGTSSGRGKTSGRGHKGDKARGTSPWYREGGSRRSRVIKHLPQRRGIGNSVMAIKPALVSLTDLEKTFAKGDSVTFEALVAHSLVHVRSGAAKISGNGKLEKALTVEVLVTQSAKEAIERAGGTVKAA